MENLLQNRPDLTRAKLERTRDLMNRWGRDWRVDALRNPPHTLADLLSKLRIEHIVKLCDKLEAHQEEF